MGNIVLHKTELAALLKAFKEQHAQEYHLLSLGFLVRMLGTKRVR